jgi:NTP pyrophosphatase (non-canonical NTP hydrolase)
MKRHNFYIPDELIEQLKNRTEKLDTTQSRLVEESLKYLFYCIDLAEKHKIDIGVIEEIFKKGVDCYVNDNKG